MSDSEQVYNIEELNAMPAEKLLAWAFDKFGERAAIGTSLQKNGSVIIDIASRLGVPFRVYFIDTLKNNPETYEFITTVEKHYGICIEVYKPDPQEVEQMTREFGQYPHLFSQSEREACCRVRKVNPAFRVTKDLDAVISGLRADQSSFRAANQAKAVLKTRVPSPLLRLHPLFDWTEDQLQAYIQEHKVPIHPLYSYVSDYGEKYDVIGCQSCHFPVQEWRATRAGKFPWEKGKKECGLHHKDGSGI